MYVSNFPMYTNLMNIHFFLTKLGAAVRAPGTRGNHVHPPGQIPQHDILLYSNVYIQLPSGQVFIGVLESYDRDLGQPSWVTSPHQQCNSPEKVYVRRPNGDRFVAGLEILPDLHIDNVQDYSSYIPIEINVVLTSFLWPVNRLRNFPGKTMIYVCMPDSNKTYMGVLCRGNGRRPDYML